MGEVVGPTTLGSESLMVNQNPQEHVSLNGTGIFSDKNVAPNNEDAAPPSFPPRVDPATRVLPHESQGPVNSQISTAFKEPIANRATSPPLMQPSHNNSMGPTSLKNAKKKARRNHGARERLEKVDITTGNGHSGNPKGGKVDSKDSSDSVNDFTRDRDRSSSPRTRRSC